MKPVAALSCVLAVCLVLPAFAGDINPPAGPVGPTMKDLDDVEPRTAIRNAPDLAAPIVIDTPGSYYLAEEIKGIGGQHGIQITTSNVTLDLNGFHIVGAEIGSLDGIHINDGLENTTILNGTVRGFADTGVYGFAALATEVRGVRSVRNLGGGILVDRATVEGCVAENNGNDGIGVGTGSTVVRCAATLNGAHGIRTGQGCAIQDCTARENANDGFIVGAYSSATNCASSQNGLLGFRLISGATVTGCSAALNGSHGFEVQNFSLGASIIHCTARGNLASGINLRDQCVATGNGCHGNTVDGIVVSGDSNRIDSNACTDNGDDGIDLNGCSNLVVRNSLSGNMFNLIEGTACDPGFENRIAVTSTDPTTAGPWHNLSHPAP